MSRFRNAIRRPGRAAATAALAISLAASPMVERIARAQDKTEQVQEKSFFSSEKLKEKLTNIKGSNLDGKLSNLFDLLKIGNGILKTDDSKGDKRPPRNVDETLEKGGDCTELSFVVITALKEIGIKGGAEIVHFDSEKNENQDHMVAYALVEVNDKEVKIHIDPQTSSLGKMNGEYELVMDLTFEEAEGMYHREMGNYYDKNGKITEAIASFEKAVELNPKDAYCYHMLGMVYKDKYDQSKSLDDLVKAKDCLVKAAELSPKNKEYKKDKAFAVYTVEIELAFQAIDKNDYKTAKKHFKNALNSGVKLTDKEEKMLKDYIKQCE